MYLLWFGPEQSWLLQHEPGTCAHLWLLLRVLCESSGRVKVWRLCVHIYCKRQVSPLLDFRASGVHFGHSVQNALKSNRTCGWLYVSDVCRPPWAFHIALFHGCEQSFSCCWTTWNELNSNKVSSLVICRLKASGSSYEATVGEIPVEDIVRIAGWSTQVESILVYMPESMGSHQEIG